MIMLADVGLEFGMTKRSKEIVQNILPQVSEASPQWRASRITVLSGNLRQRPRAARFGVCHICSLHYCRRRKVLRVAR
jgi:hypothetical protein